MSSAALQSLRSGEWLDPARRRRIAVVLAVGYVFGGAYILSAGGRIDPLGRPVGSDFAAFYGVSRALLDGSPAESLYSPRLFNDTIRDLTGGGTYVWLYPPPALLPYWPVAALPYPVALAVWILVGVAAYTASVWRALPHRAAIVPALLFPGMFACITHGHNGLLNAGLLGGGLVLISTNPIAAGALLGGVAVLKPHLALLVPVALLAGRRWWTLGSMIATAGFLAMIAALSFGAVTWSAFMGSTAISQAMLETEGVSYAKIASVFSASRLLGCPVHVAYAAQALTALGAVAVTAWFWTCQVSDEIKGAVLLLATTLATPYVYDYDLPAVSVGLALWARAAIRDGWRPWEKSAMFAVWAVPLFVRPLAMAANLGVLPLVIAAVISVMLRRAVTHRAAECA